MNKNKFDLIVIGSGIGGLTVATLMSKIFNKKVLVLEKHFRAGGFTHTFKRKNYHWDVGLHYVGDMDKKSMPRKVFDFITDGKLDWQKMNDPFEKFIYPDFTFDVGSGEANYKKDLIKKFPDEEKAIIQYFEDLKKATKVLNVYFVIISFSMNARKILLPLLNRFFKLSNLTTKEYFDSIFKDEKLKSLLASQWGDYGLSPAKSSFLIHSTIVAHYLNGGYYPVGSSSKIAEYTSQIIENKGGKVLTSHSVKEIIIKDEKAIGVKVEHKNGNEAEILEFYADNIVSNAGAYLTYKNLLDPKYSKEFIQDMESISYGTSHINVFLGLKESPEKLGFKGENHWLYESYDHDKLAETSTDNLLKGKVETCYLSFPSMKDREAKSHTAEILMISDYNQFKEWEQTTWKKRGENYESIKDTIAKNLIEYIDSKYKGFKDLVDYYEVSTPLSTAHFTSHKFGNIYGIPATPERYTKYWLGIKTPVKNLYLTGTDAGAHGIVGAMMSSIFTTAVVNGGLFKLFKIFKEISNPSKTV